LGVENISIARPGRFQRANDALFVDLGKRITAVGHETHGKFLLGFIHFKERFTLGHQRFG
jgi:hypothetical protein